MRKVIDILNELPEVYRAEMTNNLIERFGKKALFLETNGDLEWLIINYFNWGEIPKGVDYWKKIYYYL